jgi:hypothetical protein
LDPNHVPVMFDAGDHAPFLVKIKTSELQVGILELH